MDLKQKLTQKDCMLLDHGKAGLTPEEPQAEIQHQSYRTGAYAPVQSGRLSSFW